jgi:ribosomal protein S18 acetylase RimI-like enzyme
MHGEGENLSLVAAERRSALGTLVMAFAQDPVIRWFYAEPWRYLAHYADFVQAFGGQAFDEGTAWQLGDLAATGIWLSPGSQLDGDAIVAHLEATVAPEKLDDLFAVIEQMDHGHPDEPHWYLAWIGVDTFAQGRGLGGELLRRCLEVVDESHVAVYLDNTNPRNIPLYERHGFELTQESRAGGCPPVFGMLREAR